MELDPEFVPVYYYKNVFYCIRYSSQKGACAVQLYILHIKTFADLCCHSSCWSLVCCCCCGGCADSACLLCAVACVCGGTGCQHNPAKSD